MSTVGEIANNTINASVRYVFHSLKTVCIDDTIWRDRPYLKILNNNQIFAWLVVAAILPFFQTGTIKIKND